MAMHGAVSEGSSSPLEVSSPRGESFSRRDPSRHRRNTALLATGGAAYAWGKYHDKKKEENGSKPVALWQRRQVACEPREGCGKWRKGPRGHAWGYWKHHGEGHHHHGHD